MTVSPSNVEMEGNSETQHDDMSNEGHEEQFEHVNHGSKISDSDSQEGSSESTPQEKQREKAQEDEE